MQLSNGAIRDEYYLPTEDTEPDNTSNIHNRDKKVFTYI
jgi:hypothetical protein